MVFKSLTRGNATLVAVSSKLASPKLAALLGIAAVGALTLPATSVQASSSCNFQKPIGVCEVMPFPAASGTYFQLNAGHQCASVDYTNAGRSKRIFLRNGRGEDATAQGEVGILGCVAYAAERTPAPAPAATGAGAWVQQGVANATAHVSLNQGHRPAQVQVQQPSHLVIGNPTLARVRLLGQAGHIQPVTNSVTHSAPILETVAGANWVPTKTGGGSTLESVVSYPSKSNIGSSPSYPTKSNLGGTTYTETITHQPAPTHLAHQQLHVPASQPLAITHTVQEPIVKPVSGNAPNFGNCCTIGPITLAEMSPAVEGEWCHDEIGPLAVGSDRLTMTRSTGGKVTAGFVGRTRHSLTYAGSMITPYTGLIAPTTDGYLLWRDKAMGLFEKDYLMTRCENFTKSETIHINPNAPKG